MIINNAQERGRFLRFAMVGAIGAVVDFGVFNLMVNVFHMMAVVSSVFSFAAAVVSNFLWNRFWTYPDSRTKKVGRQLVQFAVVSVVGLAIRTPLFAWLEKVLVQLFGRWVPPNFIVSNVFLGHNVSLAIAILVVMMWNFFANRFWTYNDVK